MKRVNILILKCVTCWCGNILDILGQDILKLISQKLIFFYALKYGYWKNLNYVYDLGFISPGQCCSNKLG